MLLMFLFHESVVIDGKIVIFSQWMVVSFHSTHFYFNFTHILIFTPGVGGSAEKEEGARGQRHRQTASFWAQRGQAGGHRGE